MEDTQKEILDVLGKLVRIPSVADNKDALQEIVAYVKDYLSMPEFIIEEYTHNDFPSLVIKPKNWQKTKLLLNAHVDVVPANKDQFILKIQGNQAYGRGTLDMKGATAVLLVLIKKLAMENMLPNNIMLMCVTDEEVGGHNGTKYLLEEENITTDFFLAGEPTNLTICNRQKGVLWVELQEVGKKAHGSKPWLGESATILLAQKISDFYKRSPQPKKEEWITTYNLSLVNGGGARNVVPDKAMAFMDVRRIDAESSESVVENIRNSFPNTTVNVLLDEPCLFTHQENSYILKMQRSIKDTFGTQVQITSETFASDGRFYSAQAIPSVNFGPSGEDMHGDSEWVDVKSLMTYYGFMKVVLQQLTNGVD